MGRKTNTQKMIEELERECSFWRERAIASGSHPLAYHAACEAKLKKENSK